MNKGTGGVTGIYITDPFFAFHHVNAFESSSNEIILDIIAYNDSSIIRSLYLDVVRGVTWYGLSSCRASTLSYSASDE